MGLKIIKGVNLALAFFLELGVLAALAYWGAFAGQGALGKIGLGIGAPALAAVVWALFGAPRAKWHLYGPWRLILQVVFFGSAALALLSAGQRFPGEVFALLVVLNLALIYALGQSGERPAV